MKLRPGFGLYPELASGHSRGRGGPFGCSRPGANLGPTPFSVIRESKTLEYRAEFFNAFNHAQFNNPNGLFNSGAPPLGTFGLVTSARDPRIVQMALKFIF